MNYSQKNLRYFVFLTVFLDAIGIGIVIPVLPQVLEKFALGSRDQSIYFGYFSGIFAVAQFFAAPILGNLSDAFGRRKVLLFSLAGAAADYVLMAFAPTLAILFVGRIISGVTAATHTVAASSMADISTAENRSSNFGLIGAAFGLGFIFGPAIGGLLSSFGSQAPFLVAAGFCFLNFLFGIFFLPETLKPEHRRPFRLSGLNTFTSLLQLFKLLPTPILFVSYFFLFLSGNVHPVLWTLYTMHKYSWSGTDVGISLSLVGICIAFFQGFCVKHISNRIGEHKTILLGISVGALSYFLVSFANEGWQVLSLCFLFGLGGIAMPTLQSLFSKLVPPNQQGQLQGGLMALASLTSIIAPLAYSQLFGFFSQRTPSERQFSIAGNLVEFPYFPGMGYFAAGIFCLLSGLVYLHSQKRSLS